MAQRPQGLSITLPRNFAYTSPDGRLPKTPDQSFSELSLPAPPHPSSCRFRRPRLDGLTSSVTHDGTLPTLMASDIPIPSIEVELSSEMSRPLQFDQTPFTAGDRFRLSTRRDFLPPRTPPAQMPTTPTEPKLHTAWDLKRPESSCSNRSDSSASSEESFMTRPSFGGSCTSPESDFQDPFCSRTGQYLESPTKPGRKPATGTFESSLPKTRWTPEMDNHLWNVYQMYLQDPTITPFKTIPGSLPPLGVCHRVAREAKRTWPRSSRSAHGDIFRFGSPLQSRDQMPDLTSTRSGSSTPTGLPERNRSFWPKESSTRRRLKELCKRKFSIAPHYQRLLQSRSPSPFLETFTRRTAPSRGSSLAPGEDTTMTFATRDLGVSLMSSETGGHLAQLATEPSSQQTNNDDWFNSPITAGPADEMSISPPEETKPTLMHLEPPSSVPRLASPFTYNTWGPVRSRRSHRPALNQYDTMHATGRHLLSPMQLDPFSSTSKRRAQNPLDQELSPGGSDLSRNLQDLFAQRSSAESSQRRVRVRNRGFTLGDVGRRQGLSDLFTPPSPITGQNKAASSSNSLGLAPPVNDEARRLGSPFEHDAKKSLRSKSRSPRHAASTSESYLTNPFSGSMASTSIGERLAAFQSVQQEQQPGTTATNQDPFEPGLTDAERIRRQLSNRNR